MDVKTYRKKPVIVEALRYTGDNWRKLADWIGFEDCSVGKTSSTEIQPMYIHTLEGKMEASPGDYVIRGTDGEFYPCKPNIFKDIYEEV